MYRVKFIREGKEIQVEAGIKILEAERMAGLIPDAPCGGQGKCGKCRVKADGQSVLACQAEIRKDMEVDTLVIDSGYEILTEGSERKVTFRPDLMQQKVAGNG